MATLTQMPEVPASKETAPLVLLLIGPPGCGKGTQAERLKEAHGIPSISTGEMIRAEIAAGTPLGKTAQGITITGGLLGDDIVNQMMAARLARPDCQAGFLLDGYPRSVPQAEFLSGVLATMGFPQPQVIHLDVPYDHLIARTCNRRFCPQCGHIYNLLSHVPKEPNKCDQCGSGLDQRSDDCEETVKNRLQAYDKTTAPLIAFYREKEYVRVDATGAPEAVYSAVASSVRRG